MIQDVGVGIGQNIGRKGKRQDKGDLKNATPRKLGHSDKPGRTHTNRKRSGTGDQNQTDGVER